MIPWRVAAAKAVDPAGVHGDDGGAGGGAGGRGGLPAELRALRERVGKASHPAFCSRCAVACLGGDSVVV